MLLGYLQNQRLIIEGSRELWAQSFAPAVFEARNDFRKADKPQLTQSVIM